MKKTWSAAISLIFVAAFASSVTLGIITARQSTAEPPDLELGDWWAYQETYSWDGGQQVISERRELTSYSGDKWVFDVSMDLAGIPNDPRFTIEQITMEVDKATFLVEWRLLQGVAPWLEEPEVVRPYSEHSAYSYEFPDGPLWPLSVGKKIRVIESSYRSSQYTDIGDTTSRSSTMAYTCEVARMESVTVPAGTFRCFRVLRYIEGLDTGIQTKWYSPDAKNWVKTMEVFRDEDYETISVVELESYSLSA